jgi:error-prone DNA polymerase
MAACSRDMPEALHATRELADRLSSRWHDLGYRFPATRCRRAKRRMSFLRKITQAGARERYRPYHDQGARADRARTRPDRAAEPGRLLPDRLGHRQFLPGARHPGAGAGLGGQQRRLLQPGHHGGRSGGDGAAVRAVPVEERGEWPDIDLDLPSGDRRERVIQDVYQKYGTHGAAMTANVITYRGRSAARDWARRWAFPADDRPARAKLIAQFELRRSRDTLARNREAGIDPDIRGRYRQFATLWQQMQDLPRHLGQHSGGMVVCQGRLDTVVPLENASMPGRVVVQWDKEDCADMGIIKVDLLGLGMMAALQEAMTARRG